MVKTFLKFRASRRAGGVHSLRRFSCEFVLLLSAIIIGCAGLALPAAGAPATQSPPPSPTNRLTVLILGFENKTGSVSNAFWNAAIADLLGDQLDDVKSLRLLSSYRYALRQVHKKRGDALSVAEAAEAGSRVEARRVIWGSFDRKNGKWLLTVRVLNAATGAVSADLKAAAADWFDVRDQIVRKILNELSAEPTAAERAKMNRRETSSPAAFESVAHALALQGESGSESELEALARKAIAADAAYSRAHVILGAILANEGNSVSAEKSMRHALELEPDNDEAHLDLGHLLAMRGEFEKAETELQAALRLDPDSPDAWEMLGEIAAARGGLDLAAENFHHALRLDPWAADVHARLGAIYAMQGLHDQAVAELKRAEPLANADDIGDQQALGQTFDTLHEISSAITHYENMLSEVKKEGVNRNEVVYYENRLKALKQTLTPVYLSAAQPKDYDAAALAKILSEKLSPDELAGVTNPLAATPEMDGWGREITAGATNDLDKAQRLFNTLSRHVDEGSQGQRTAQQTFAVWRSPDANLVCQEYAFLYVALSRAVGLKTYYVFVEQECNGGHVLHACAALFTDGKVLLIDPMFRWFGVPHKKFTVLDDLQTIAIYLACHGDAPSAQIAVKLEPDWEFVRLAAANVLINEKQLDAARKILPAETLARAQGWLADLLRAVFDISENRDDDAIGWLKKGLAENPEYADAYGVLGTIYAEKKNWTAARENFQLALKYCLQPAKANDYRAKLGRIEEIIGTADPADTGPIDAMDYVIRGDAKANRGELAGAIADFTKAIELDPKSTPALLHRGVCFLRQDETNRATADLQAAIALDPQNADGYGYLGLLNQQMNDFDNALKNLRKAVVLGNHQPDVYAALTWILGDGPIVFRDTKEAVEVGTRGCVLSDWKDAHCVAMLASANVAQHDYEAAVKLAKTALDLPNLNKGDEKYLRGVITDYEHPTTPLPPKAGDASAADQSQEAPVLPPSELAGLKDAAQSGNARAQIAFANLLYEGKGGVAVDHVAAYKWAAVAAAGGSTDAAALQREFDLFMTASEIASGKAAADAFLKTAPKPK